MSAASTGDPVRPFMRFIGSQPIGSEPARRHEPCKSRDDRKRAGVILGRYGCGGKRSNAGSSCARFIQRSRSATWICIVAGTASGSS